MRKTREGIGLLRTVLFLCLVLILTAVPVCAEPASGTEKTETKAAGTGSGAAETESKSSGNDSGAEKTGSTAPEETVPDVPLTEHTQAEAVDWLHGMVGPRIECDGA